jgi:hypothetical protein
LIEVAEKLMSDVPPADAVRELRAVGVLQRLKTPEARKVLELLAEGEPGAPLTSEAQLALKKFHESPST